MDIRKYIKRPRESADVQMNSNSKQLKIAAESTELANAQGGTESNRGRLTDAAISNFSEYDIGIFINAKQEQRIPDALKYRLLVDPFKPAANYDFKADSDGKRILRFAWLEQYSPWLAYSAKLRGALCIYCVLFPQPVTRGFQGSFIASAFIKYKDFNECARNHTNSVWHKGSAEDATMFIAVKDNPSTEIVCQIDNSIKCTVDENRNKLFPILSTIIFCGTNDLALRGKHSDDGNVQQLFKLRVEAGDKVLKDHLELSAANARYTSHRTQNELIALCEQVVRNDIVTAANNSIGFSILADETADIAGTEQLSIGVRFVEIEGNNIKLREEFLGFSSLTDMSATAIADSILRECKNVGLNLNKLLGQGYDGCSAMAGKDNGVQAKIRQIYPKAAFVHCASHRLNLVVNDLNAVAEVRNAVGTIKAVITFFRESPKRRALVPNVPLLCETRWTSKYKSIRIFSEHFEAIVSQLDGLSATSTGNTRQTAHQLLQAAISPGFLFCLIIIAYYSAILEPVTQALQAVNLDLRKVQNHVETLLKTFRVHRQEAGKYFKSDIFEKVKLLADNLNIQLLIPRQCKRQTHRNNPGSTNVEDYFRQTLFIPYLDSIITSLSSRFSDTNSAQFNLFSLHPTQISQLDCSNYLKQMSAIHTQYEIDNFEREASAWYDVWCASPMQSKLKDADFIDLLSHTDFYPSIREAILILLTLPTTTCAIERSFSTLHRVKTWLRSTMADDRLSGLSMMSVHREK